MDQFYSLDGNLYSFIDTEDELRELLFLMESYEAGIYKIFSSKINLQKTFQDPDFSFKRIKEIEYKTNFYQIEAKEIPQILNNLKTTYNQDVYSITKEVLSTSDSDLIATLKEFTQHVSAYKQINGNWVGDEYRIKRCDSFFERALNQDNLQAFLVANLEGELAGSFCLVETKYDVQLESVSGKSQKYKTLEGFKFPYLMKSVLEIYSSSFAHKPLRFSSSKKKVMDLYKQAGFNQISNVTALKFEVV